MSGPSTVLTVAVALCLGVFFSRRLWWSLQSSCSVNVFAVSPPKDLRLNLQPCTTVSLYDDDPPPPPPPQEKKKKKAITCQCFSPPKDMSVDQSTIHYHIILCFPLQTPVAQSTTLQYHHIYSHWCFDLRKAAAVSFCMGVFPFPNTSDLVHKAGV